MGELRRTARDRPRQSANRNWQTAKAVARFMNFAQITCLICAQLAHDDSNCGFIPLKRCPKWFLSSDLKYA